MISKVFTALPLAVLGAAAAGCAGLMIYSNMLYDSGSDFIEDRTISTESDMVREDWQKIQSGKFSMEHLDFKSISSIHETRYITQELARQFCGADRDTLPSYMNETNDSLSAIYDIKDGVSDLAFIVEPDSYLTAEAEKIGIKPESVTIAHDCLVFFTSRDNPVSGLTQDQIRDIYSGKITNWREVGGNDSKILAYQRDHSTDSQRFMERAVMKGENMASAADSYQEHSVTHDYAPRIGEYRNTESSIGYVMGYCLERLYSSEDIKILCIDGVFPDNRAVRNGWYPFTQTYCAVTAKGGDKRAEEICSYLLSDEGQQIIQYAGFCPARPVKGE